MEFIMNHFIYNKKLSMVAYIAHKREVPDFRKVHAPALKARLPTHGRPKQPQLRYCTFKHRIAEKILGYCEGSINRRRWRRISVFG